MKNQWNRSMLVCDLEKLHSSSGMKGNPRKISTWSINRPSFKGQLSRLGAVRDEEGEDDSFCIKAYVCILIKKDAAFISTRRLLLRAVAWKLLRALLLFCAYLVSNSARSSHESGSSRAWPARLKSKLSTSEICSCLTNRNRDADYSEYSTGQKSGLGLYWSLDK